MRNVASIFIILTALSTPFGLTATLGEIKERLEAPDGISGALLDLVKLKQEERPAALVALPRAVQAVSGEKLRFLNVRVDGVFLNSEKSAPSVSYLVIESKTIARADSARNLKELVASIDKDITAEFLLKTFFDPHYSIVLQDGTTPAEVTVRLAVLRGAGIDCIRLKFVLKAEEKPLLERTLTVTEFAVQTSELK